MALVSASDSKGPFPGACAAGRSARAYMDVLAASPGKGPLLSGARSAHKLPAPGLPGAGNLPAVSPKRQSLDQVGNGLAHRQEARLDVPIGCDVGHTTRK